MSYRHGIYGTEIPTSILPPIRTSAGLIVAIGTAPINQLGNYAEAVNKPILAYSYAEAVKTLGYSSDVKSYTLCEVMRVCFGLYGVAPVVLINVLSLDHIVEYQGSVTLINGKAMLSHSGVLPDTIRITDESKKYYNVSDFSHAFSDAGKCVISCISSGKINNDKRMSIEYKYLDPTRVKSKDIIGGINVSSHKAEGLELLNEVYPRFGLIPGQIIAPRFSGNSEVGQLMALKAGTVSDIFNAEALTDVLASSGAGALNYKKAVEKKKDHNWVAKTQTVCWPMVKSGNEIHHFSTHLAAATCLLDSHNADIPYRSPSNKTLQMSSAVLGDGTEVWNGLGAANYLNSQGIVTSYHKNGWKTWGNRTAAYPSSTDPKDSFRACRRMFNWVLNTLIETYWSKIDDPTNKRLIQSVVTSANIWLNGLTANENIAGGRVVFIEKENAVTDLMDGILRFHVFLTPFSPAREIDFVMEYDPNYLNNLFSSSAS
ncbi:major tail sheath protein [Yersinia aldovae]|uniref:phage tail sheath family protein n=1 Tax=Yersinia aldovae TaxID=29483 RepID=UPI0005DD77BB|nr:phage tail protein [Yersinia aldovae]CNK29400.1 major tail sheath protein [Yersinia aldovae]